MAGHPSRNPELRQQHKEKQRQGDEELANSEGQNADASKHKSSRNDETTSSPGGD